MISSAVHWHERMFMRPQHFQAAQRYLLDQLQRSHKWDVHYGWGVRTLDLSFDGVGNQRLVVRKLEARLPDGTLVCIPDDGNLPLEVPIKEALRAHNNSLKVFLGVPALMANQVNTTSGDGDGHRFRVESLDVLDENTGLNPQPISVRRLQPKLLLGDEDQAGYRTLPLARITRSEGADGAPVLDRTYIPPLLSCDAWAPLHADILQEVLRRVDKKINDLAEAVTSRDITFDRQEQGDVLMLNQLRKLNESFHVLHVLQHAKGVHPLWAYTEMCRVIGQLAIFGAARRAPDLPHYDHDDLQGCFAQVKKHIDDYLDFTGEPGYRERFFLGAGLRMQVSLEPAWREEGWQLFVGVSSSLDEDACIKMLTRPGQLDMKIGSSDRVEDIFKAGEPGLRFEHQRVGPRSLTIPPGWVLFQVKRDPRDLEWQSVLKNLNLAVRINENLIASSINGQRVLTIKTPTKTTKMEFRLFAVPPDKR